MSYVLTQGQLLERSLWAALAAVAYAAVFNVPRRALFACALDASAGYFLRGMLVLSHFASAELATLIASTVVSLLAVAWGRALRAPALMFAIPGVIPFVPGALAVLSTNDAIALVTRDEGEDRLALIDSLLTHSLTTLLIVLAMAGGVAVPSLLFRRRRPLI